MWDFLVPGSMTQTLLVGLVVGLVIYRFMRNRKYNMPPGPISLPLIGNILQLGSDERYHRKIFEWSQTYGPVVTVGLGPVKMVFVNNLETAMEVLVKRSTDFAGRFQVPSLSKFFDGFKDIAFANYGPTWKLHRKIASKALRHYMQGQALENRIHTALEAVLPVLNDKTEPFSPDEVIDYLVSNILIGLCFHGKYEYGNKELQYVLDLSHQKTIDFNMFIPEDVIPGLQYVYKSAAMEKVDAAYNGMVTNFMERKYYEEKKTFDRDNIRHFTDMLLLAKEEAETEEGHGVEHLTDTHLIQTLADIFFAGIDTTRLSLYFAVLHMIAFPDIQKKVQEELDREVGLNRLPGVADRPNLGYTEAVLHESMRLATVVPTGLMHKSLCDTEISGYTIPKDTIVTVNHWGLHNDPNAWKDVEKFIPERYLDENGRLGPKPPNWLPFSAGKRVCLGEFVAKPELHTMFAALMQQFTWKSELGVKPDIDPKGNIFNARPAPYKVNVSRRTKDSN